VEGPESIYTLKQDQCIAHDTQAEVPGIEFAQKGEKRRAAVLRPSKARIGA
jgi:hypothetical protein